MSRDVIVGTAQLGPVGRHESRGEVVRRRLTPMREAHFMRRHIVTFPGRALTTLFPRRGLADAAEIDSFYETEMPGPETCCVIGLQAGAGAVPPSGKVQAAP